MSTDEKKAAVEMRDEELAQVQGGFSIAGMLTTLEMRFGQGGTVTTLEEKFDSLAGLSTLELRSIPWWDRRYKLAQEYLKYLSEAGKAETVSL